MRSLLISSFLVAAAPASASEPVKMHDTRMPSKIDYAALKLHAEMLKQRKVNQELLRQLRAEATVSWFAKKSLLRPLGIRFFPPVIGYPSG